MQRIIREEEPQKPSTRLSAQTDTLPGVAAVRGLEPGRLTRLVRGDLDWIVMKALEKDRGRRYETANGLAMDVQRYLSGEAVVAAPPSAAYRVRKFVRRNRGAVLAGTVVAAALIAATGVSLTFASRAMREAARATREAARADAETAEAKKQAKAAAERWKETQQVADFQASQLRDVDVQGMGARMRQDLLAEARAAMKRAKLDPSDIEARGAQFEELLAGVNMTNVILKQLDRDIFERALKALNEKFAKQPLVQAQLLQTLAETLRAIGLFDRATAPQNQALTIRRRVLGDDDPNTLVSINHTGMLLKAQGKLAEAEPFIREAMETCRHLMGDEHTNTLASINNMGALLETQGKLAEAEPYFREALEKGRRTLGDEHPDTLAAINNMGDLLHKQGKLAEAEPYCREALEKSRRVLGRRAPGHTNLGQQHGLSAAIAGQVGRGRAIPPRSANRILQEAWSRGA